MSSRITVDRRVAVSTDAWRTASVPLARSVCTVAFPRTATDGPIWRGCRGLTSAAEASVYRGVPPGGPGFPRGWAGGGRGALMGGLVVRESVTLAGIAERARVARGFVAGVLGSGHPCGDEAV